MALIMITEGTKVEAKVGSIFVTGIFFYFQDDDELSYSALIQHFSPIVTSLQLMNCQFGNSYTSVQCKDGTNMVFNQVRVVGQAQV
jgi:hypothetical protein